MLRAIACFFIIVGILTIAAAAACVAMQATGLSGLPGYLVAVAVFVLILTVAVMVLASMNDRMNR